MWLKSWNSSFRNRSDGPSLDAAPCSVASSPIDRIPLTYRARTELHRRGNVARGSSLIRTLVVACATLAILFVCFSMYQFSQSSPNAAVEVRKPRLPSLLNERSTTSAIDPVEAPSASLGDGAAVGPGRDIRLTIFPREGVHARMEVEVRDWTPRPGASNEFLLVAPVIRLRTNDGNAVRVSAGEGVLEAERRSGGSLDPRRGRLSKQVVVEYDRVPEKDRAALPPPHNTQPEPGDLVRVEMEAVEFDLEYGKLTASGEVRLTARDASFTANDLEARFGEHADRLESLRIAHGGRIELSPESADFGGAIPGLDASGVAGLSDQQTVAEWLWKTFQQRFDVVPAASGPESQAAKALPREARSSPGETESPGGFAKSAKSVPQEPSPLPLSLGGRGVAEMGAKSAEAPAGSEAAASSASPAKEMRVTMTAEGVPVFRPGSGESRPKPKTPAQYFATFRTQVTVEQRVGDATVSRLWADELDIVRPFTEQDRRSAGSTKQEPASVGRRGESTATRDTKTASAASEQGSPQSNSARSRIVVTWADQLVVESLTPDDARWSATHATSVTAIGAPVRLTHRDGDATCAKLEYEPDASKVSLFGTESDPLRMNSHTQGTMTSMAAVLHRTGERFSLHAIGPGELSPRSDQAPGAAATATASLVPSASTGSAASSSPTIRFRDRLEAEGRLETATRVDFSGHVVTEELRLLERATFTGATRVQQEDFSLESDELALTFGVRRGWLGTKPAMESLTATGHSTLIRGHDRIVCDELKAQLQTEGNGRNTPRVVIAKGNVVANQGERTISAKDELAVEFGMLEPAGDPIGGSLPPADANREPQLAARRLRASGGVKVIDPKVEVRAADLDCTLDANQQIVTAVVNGSPEESATIRSEGSSVTGRHIEWFGPDERAEVPGEGRLTLRSANDLNGARSRDEEGVPIAITWTERMRYSGRENQAVFVGKVHATSAETSTFDCDRLTVEFEPAPDGSVSRTPSENEPRTRGIADVLQRVASATAAIANAEPASTSAAVSPGQGVSPKRSMSVAPKRQIESILASGNAVAVATEMDSATDQIRSRARISGPRLSVNLRPDIQKMRIEGPGDLLIENFEERRATPPVATQLVTAPAKRGLLTLNDDDGPSKTLIRWKDSMQYDFSLNQTRFEGDAELKFLSGGELDKLFQRPSAAAKSGGRFTYLKCDTLTADFLGKEGPKRSREDDRMGRLSASDLRQFEASGAVQLQDETEGLSILADRIVFERARRILSIDANEPRKARLVKQQPGQLPYQVTVSRLVYNLATGQVELSQPTGIGH